MKNLANRNCLITGAASGIGRSLALGLAREGANLFLADLDMEGLQTVEKEIQDKKGNVFIGNCDVSSRDSMNLLSSEVYKRFGDLDLLINCAGVGGSGGSFEAFTIEDDWKKVIDINMWSIIYSIYAFLPGMMKRGAGHIVNVASVGGVIGEPYNLPYVASKFAVVGLSEALYTELRKKNGIRVSVICPSPIKTPIMNKMKFRFSDELMSSFGLASFGQKEHDAFQRELKEWYNRHGLTSDEAARRYIRGIKRETLYIFDGRIYQLIISLKGISSHLYEWFLRYLGNMYTKMLKDIIGAIQEKKSL